jgi:hypothetical protein
MALIPSSSSPAAISLGGSCGPRSVEKELAPSVPQYNSSGTATISLNDSAVRTLLGVPSGAISLSSAYGKTSFRATVAVLAVGGGGGGGIGGGGGGGIATGIVSCLLHGASFTVTVGSGGGVPGRAGNCQYPDIAQGQPGGTSSVSGPTSFTAYGGGGGGANLPGPSMPCPSSFGLNSPGYPSPNAGGGGGAGINTLVHVCHNYCGGHGGSYGSLANGGPIYSIIPYNQTPNIVGGGGGSPLNPGGPGWIYGYLASCAQSGSGANGYAWFNGQYYGGGGGAMHAFASSTPLGSNTSGGLGGGGKGASGASFVVACSGTPGTGGGGGGGVCTPVSHGFDGAGLGGPGTVIFVYSSPSQYGTGGSVTNISSLPGSPYYPASTAASQIGNGPYWVHTFTSSGTFSL